MASTDVLNRRPTLTVSGRCSRGLHLRHTLWLRPPTSAAARLLLHHASLRRLRPHRQSQPRPWRPCRASRSEGGRRVRGKLINGTESQEQPSGPHRRLFSCIAARPPLPAASGCAECPRAARSPALEAQPVESWGCCTYILLVWLHRHPMLRDGPQHTSLPWPHGCAALPPKGGSCRAACHGRRRSTIRHSPPSHLESPEPLPSVCCLVLLLPGAPVFFCAPVLPLTVGGGPTLSGV